VYGKRYLIVVADDYGMGPATSQGIVHLATRGLVTGAVLLVNSPYAEEAVHAWRLAGKPMDLGWHPCLTLDAPVLPPKCVSSLVGRDGRFLALDAFLRRILLAQIRPAEVAAELRAQLKRFLALVGCPPAAVNSHQHVQLFHPIGPILLDLLAEHGRPYVRRIQEPVAMLARIPGARLKRTFLTVLGQRQARKLSALAFPGNNWLAGITDPHCVTDPAFFARWLARIPGDVVELACHPGYLDTALVGRDCSAADGRLARRVEELHLMQAPSFREACQRAGFTLIGPSQLTELPLRHSRVA
jgi:predicted glycoside hydrolase/deacetylase ChbG (UPF0249 family)